MTNLQAYRLKNDRNYPLGAMDALDAALRDEAIWDDVSEIKRLWPEDFKRACQSRLK